MKDCDDLVSQCKKGQTTYADGTGDTLVGVDVLGTFLDLGTGLLTDELHAHILLATTELRGIDSDEDSLDTTLLGVLDVLPVDFTVAVDVKLDEEGLAWRGSIDDLVEGAGGEGGDLESKF